MSRAYPVVATDTFQQDIERLEEHIVQRELASHTPDDTCLFRFRDAVERAMDILAFAPHTCRRCEAHRALRELIVPFGRGGCVLLFAMRETDVVLLAARTSMSMTTADLLAGGHGELTSPPGADDRRIG